MEGCGPRSGLRTTQLIHKTHSEHRARSEYVVLTGGSGGYFDSYHWIEVLRTGADPVNDPLWIVTAVPAGSTVDHGGLRLTVAKAASEGF